MLRFIFKRSNGQIATMDVRSLGGVEQELRLGAEILGVELQEEKGVTDNELPKELCAS